MALLPDMQPFYLGQLLDVGKGVNYIGGLDISNSDPCRPEYAFFTSEEEENDSNDSDVVFAVQHSHNKSGLTIFHNFQNTDDVLKTN